MTEPVQHRSWEDIKASDPDVQTPEYQAAYEAARRDLLADTVTVWKYPLSMTSPNYEITMPAGAEILVVQAQHDVPCIWALVNPGHQPETRRFVMVGTGHPFSMNGVTGQHIGTFQLMQGSFVGHLFELARIDSGDSDA